MGLQCDNYTDLPGDLGLWLQHGKGLLGSGSRSEVRAGDLVAEAHELAAEIAADFRLMMRNFVALIT